MERTGTSDPSRSTRDLVKMEGAGIDPKEEGVGILLRKEEGEGIVPREEEGNNRRFLG